MAGLCGVSVRVSWISCLLISSITCLPALKGYGSNNPGSAASGFRGWPSTSGSTYSNDGGFSVPQASGSSSSGYGSNVGYDNSGYSNVGYGSVGAGYAGAGYAGAGYDGGYVASYAEGDVDQSSEAVLSDMSDLEPVYSFRSRSGYQLGRASVSQTRYIPGEGPLPPIQLVQRIYQQPAQAPAKGPSKGKY
ncbi:uncharacterized protein LOC131975272 [Centropristis striata]|uniref:uncharacterized protein LOC131975272 n=1 Tax=Centropristis striata TaxID=184440 RepID=UPI0027DFD68F|nr:uncharacterized protein LOC131975272 [Centropristis striata]